MTSPFRISVNDNGDIDPNGWKQKYRWPPAPQEVEKLYDRVTELISVGEPQQQWMPHWFNKLIPPLVSENLVGFSDFVYNEDGDVRTTDGFPFDEDWWESKLWRAKRRDERERARGRNSDRLGSTQAWSNKQKFEWYLREYPDSVRNSAAKLGTQVHGLVEQTLLTGKSVEVVPASLMPRYNNALRFLNDFMPDFIEIESCVYSNQHGTGGQIDAIAIIDGKTTMIDWKTGESGVKSTLALQFSNYGSADFIGRIDGTKDEVPHIDQYWGIGITDDDYKINVVTVDDEVHKAAQAVRDMAYWISEKAATVLRDYGVVA